MVTGPSQINGHSRQRIKGPSNSARFSLNIEKKPPVPLKKPEVAQLPE